MASKNTIENPVTIKYDASKITKSVKDITITDGETHEWVNATFGDSSFLDSLGLKTSMVFENVSFDPAYIKVTEGKDVKVSCKAHFYLSAGMKMAYPKAKSQITIWFNLCKDGIVRSSVSEKLPEATKWTYRKDMTPGLKGQFAIQAAAEIIKVSEAWAIRLSPAKKTIERTSI